MHEELVEKHFTYRPLGYRSAAVLCTLTYNSNPEDMIPIVHYLSIWYIVEVIMHFVSRMPQSLLPTFRIDLVMLNKIREPFWVIHSVIHIFDSSKFRFVLAPWNIVGTTRTGTLTCWNCPMAFGRTNAASARTWCPSCVMRLQVTRYTDFPEDRVPNGLDVKRAFTGSQPSCFLFFFFCQETSVGSLHKLLPHG